MDEKILNYVTLITVQCHIYTICVQCQKIKDWTLQAASLHRKAGQPDSCASLLEKVGRALEHSHPKYTVLMLEMAAETVETENRPFQAACYTSRLLR